MKLLHLIFVATLTSAWAVPAQVNGTGQLIYPINFWDANQQYIALDGSQITTGTISPSRLPPFGGDVTSMASGSYVNIHVINSGGGSVAWGGITGTLASQSDLASALALKAALASPTFTGTVSVAAESPFDVSLVVNGFSQLLGGVYSDADGYFAGQVTADGGLSVTGVSSFGGTINITGTNDLQVGGDTNMNGTLNVNSTTNLNGDTTVGNLSVGTSLSVPSIPVYADNAAATSGGLAVGKVYRTATGQLMVRF